MTREERVRVAVAVRTDAGAVSGFSMRAGVEPALGMLARSMSQLGRERTGTISSIVISVGSTSEEFVSPMNARMGLARMYSDARPSPARRLPRAPLTQ